MFTQIRKPDRHFRAYYEDNSLLIQFMIVEFVHTAQLTLRLKASIEKHLTIKHLSLNGIHDVKHILEFLIHAHPPQQPHSHTRWTKGPLLKLKEYCELFSLNSSHQNKQHSNLHMSTHQALLNAMHAQELLNALCVNASITAGEKGSSIQPLKRILDSFHGKIQQVIRHFPQVMSPYCENENVILCLLRIYQSLVDIYGVDFIDKRLKWDVKSNELLEFLSDRYKERGFEALLSTIQQLHEANER